jgi:triacylglycerol lipase
VNGTYLFGSPWVGNKDFEQKLEADSGSRIIRFVNNNDLVTHVPPRCLGYSHVGKLLYFNEDGKSLEVDASYWYRFLELFKGVFEDFGDLGTDQFKDHSMDCYLSRTKLHRANNPFK